MLPNTCMTVIVMEVQERACAAHDVHLTHELDEGLYNIFIFLR